MISVKSEVDFLHILDDVVVASSSASLTMADGVPGIASMESSVWLDTMLGDVGRRGELTVEVDPKTFLDLFGDTYPGFVWMCTGGGLGERDFSRLLCFKEAE